MKTIEKWMHKLDKKRSHQSYQTYKEKHAKRPAEPAMQAAQLHKKADTEAEIEKAFAEYLNANNEASDDTLLRYIAQITK